MKRFAACFVLVVAASAFAQGPGSEQPDTTLDAAARAAVIEGALKHLEEGYVFPDVAKKMAASVREKARKKEYDAITSARELAARLTADLQEVSRDKHLRVRYSHRPIPVRQPSEEPTAEQRREMEEFLRTTNYGFEKVERLPGNVGYIEIRGFVPAGPGGATASAAMNFVAGTDALIIDLRRNGGGNPGMVALVSSYLFDGEPVHLNSLYWRDGERTEQFWTNPWVPGPRFGGKKPVYVLTAKRTFSAAEEFTYNLQSRKRATIVGETTGGGAHPGGERRINEHFSVWVPSGRAINPVTKTNWEGTGVKPDIETTADDALKTAQRKALEHILAATTDPERRGALERALADLR